MSNIASIRDVIALWPTRPDLASDLSAVCEGHVITKSRIDKWAENGSIPAKYHAPLVSAAAVRGFPVTAQLLADLHSLARGVSNASERGAAA